MRETPQAPGEKPVGRALGSIPRRSARLAETLRIGLASIAVLAFGDAAVRAANCDYYASPSGTGNGLSSSSPFKISNFWPVAAAGKTLCLLDGTYTDGASMILPPQGLNGAPGIPITIRALNDGKVLIDSGGWSPVRLLYNDWFVIEGINACCANETVVQLSHSNNNVIRRVAAWDAADNNSNIFGLHSSSFNLLEDVAGWGTARKIFSMAQAGDHTTIRRAWGRWERSTVVGPKMTYTLAYNNYHLTCENCLGTWSGQGMPETYALMGYDGKPWTGNGAGTYTDHDLDQPYGIFGIDREDGDKNAYAKLLGSLAYVLPTDTYKPPQVVWVTGLDSVEIKDTAAYIAPGTNTSVRPFGLYGPVGATNLHASDITSLGQASSTIQTVWNPSNILSGAPSAAYTAGETIFNASRGASLCYQYKDGSPTGQPLWPWPMNQRIKDALVQSGRASVDITATIQSLFGTIPAACLAGSTAPPSPTPTRTQTPTGTSPTATPKPPTPTATPAPTLKPPSPTPTRTATPKPPSPTPTRTTTPKPPSPTPTRTTTPKPPSPTPTRTTTPKLPSPTPTRTTTPKPPSPTPTRTTTPKPPSPTPTRTTTPKLPSPTPTRTGTPNPSGFGDVPTSDPFSPYIQTIHRLGITAGCGGGNFCPNGMATNSQMAVFLLRSRFGSAYVPPPATGKIFADVRTGDFAADWIEALYNKGFTGGCSSNPRMYCPGAAVTREQMAKLLLLAKYGGGNWSPPAATGIFRDVPRTNLYAPWIEQFMLLGITAGCQANPPLYCPTNPITRAQMAVFLVRTFGLK